MTFARRSAVTTWEGSLDEDRFRSIVDDAAALCPVSRLFAGAQISVAASLHAA